MRRTMLFVCLIIAVSGSICSAAPPRASSLREAWQNVTKKCGTLVAGTNGFYEFSLDEVNPQEGSQCIVQVGSDVILFGPNSGASFAHLPKEYVLVPMERIVLRIRQ